MQFSYTSEQLQKQESVPWLWVGYGFPVAAASGLRTQPLIKECRAGKTLVSQWQSPALQLTNGSRRNPLCDQTSEDKHYTHTYLVTEYPPSDVCCNAYPEHLEGQSTGPQPVMNPHAVTVFSTDPSLLSKGRKINKQTKQRPGPLDINRNKTAKWLA